MKPEEKENKSKTEETKESKKDKYEKYAVKNKYDPFTMKYNIDEYIIDTIAEDKKVIRRYGYDNKKIVLSIIVSGIVALSHFYPIPFPQNFKLLLGCVIAYFILNTFLTYYDDKVIANCFIEFQTQKIKWAKFRSNIELCDDKYKFTCEYLTEKSDKPQQISRVVELRNCFNKQGKINYPHLRSFLFDVVKTMNNS